LEGSHWDHAAGAIVRLQRIAGRLLTPFHRLSPHRELRIVSLAAVTPAQEATVSDLLERITLNPEVRSGKPVIRGTRITVSDILEYLAGGMSHEDLLADFPDLSEDDIRAALMFAAERERRLFSTS
jgi:uncharacterized protein (DUF433 family)